MASTGCIASSSLLRRATVRPSAPSSSLITMPVMGSLSSFYHHRSFSTSAAPLLYSHRGDALGYSAGGSEDLVGEDGVWDDGPAGYEWKARVLQERRALAMDYLGDVRKRVPIHNAVRTRARMNRERLMRDLHGRTDGHYPQHMRAARRDAGDGHAEEDAAVQGNVGGASGYTPFTSMGGRAVPVLNDDSPAAILTETLRASHYNPALDVHAPMGSDTAARLAVAATYDAATRDLLGSKASSATSVSAAEGIAGGRRRMMDAIDLVEEELEDLVADEGVLETLASIPPEDLRELRHEFFGGAPEVNSTFNKDSTDETLREWLKIRKDSSQFQSFTSVPGDERREWAAWYLRDVRSNKVSREDRD